MSLPRRLTALVTSLLLLQLTQAGSAFACVEHTHGEDGASAEHGGMTMSGSPRSESGVSHEGTVSGLSWEMSSQGADDSCGAVHGQSSCPAQGTDSECRAMTSCAPAVLGADVAGAPVVASHTARAIAAPILTVPTRTIVPELPPPRA